MRNIGYILILLCFIYSCDNQNSNDINKKRIEDSLYISKQYQKYDSIYNKYKDGISIHNSFDFGYIRVKIISNFKFNKELQYQLDEYGVYGYKTAERNYTYASIKIKIESKETPKDMGIKVDEYSRLYLPRLSLYEVVDSVKSQKIKWLYDIDEYDMVYRIPKHIPFMENYFDYEEKGDLIFYALLNKEIQKKKLLLTIRSGKSYGEDPTHSFINLENIIWKN